MFHIFIRSFGPHRSGAPFFSQRFRPGGQQSPPSTFPLNLDKDLFFFAYNEAALRVRRGGLPYTKRPTLYHLVTEFPSFLTLLLTITEDDVLCFFRMDDVGVLSLLGISTNDSFSFPAYPSARPWFLAPQNFRLFFDPHCGKTNAGAVVSLAASGLPIFFFAGFPLLLSE